ncbi:MAG: NAD(P)-dependent oxidoreductase [Betaproteobacteria bacterium]|nr:NAD(P)-dependent oxidoreductase [Betaproteobacteria bacterium]
MKIGFIGLGRMGHAMATRLIAAGHEVLVYNRSAAKAADLVRAGARPAASVAAACAGREAVITMVADDAALAEVTLGEQGIVPALAKGAMHLSMGTHGVGVIRALTAAHAEAGQIHVAAPMLGRPEAVAAGQAGIVAAGPAGALARCAPLFQALGRRVFEAGDEPVGATSIKLANNFLLSCAIEAMGEAFSLVRKYGVAPAALYDIIADGMFTSPAYKIYGKIIADESYDQVGFTTQLALKDSNLVLAAAEAARVPLPSAGVVRDRLLGAIAHGDADKDWAAMARDQARASGLE